MRITNQISLTRKLLRGIMFLIIFLSTFLGAGTLPLVQAQEGEQASEVCMLTGTVQLTQAEIQSIKSALGKADSEVNYNGAKCFAPIDLRDEGEWKFVTLVGLKDIKDDTSWTVSKNGVWSDNVIIHITGTEILTSIAGTLSFSESLADVPESIVPSDAKRIIDPLSTYRPNATIAETYRFPLELGYQVYYGTKGGGVHAGEFTAVLGGDSLAVDLMSDGNTVANHAPNRLLAVAPGIVVKKCSDGSKNSTYLIIDNGSSKFLYAHIRSLTAPPLWAVITSAGTIIGELVPGSFNDGFCGYASQTASFFHVHLEFLTTLSLTLSDWTLNTSAETWQRGAEVWHSGEWKQVGSSGGTGCTQISYTGVILYENANCNGDVSGVTKSFSSATSWLDIVSDPIHDKTSSIHVAPGWSIKAYEKSIGEGGGSWRCATGSMWDLSGDTYTSGDSARKMNDDISSLQIYTDSNCGSGGTPSWSAKYFNGHDHWWDTNNFNNQMCQETINSSSLDKSYGSSAPCNNGVSDNWVAEYNTTINFSPANYVFQAENNDGLKMWVNGTNILERGGSQGLSYVCPARSLSGNVPIRTILNEENGVARVKIAWTTDTSVCNLPGAFNKIGPSNGAKAQPINPMIGWSSSSGADDYSYCIDTSNDTICDTGWQGIGNITSQSLSGLITGTTYYWQVRSHSSGGETYSDGGVWWSFTTQPDPVPTELLVNGGFEDGTTDPTGWGKDAWTISLSTFEWSSDFFRSGGKSVKISNNTANDARWTQTVTVQPNTNYRLSGWIMTHAIAHSSEANDVGATLSILDGTLKYSSPSLIGDNPWTYVSLDFNTGSNTQITVAARLGMYSGITTGSAWFDDLKLELLNSTPTFGDVPLDHPQYKYIQALWDGGYTGGCSTDPLMFCPDTILDRAQAAVFMLRGQLGSAYLPPPAPWNTFADDWTGFEWAEPWVDGMWQEGLTAGCQTSPLMYCPATQLPRVEASVFGLRMKYGVDYIPPPATGTLLADMTDPAYWGASWAEQAYLDGLLPECGTQSGKPLFCPSELVSRAWGAYLIVQAKDLLPAP